MSKQRHQPGHSRKHTSQHKHSGTQKHHQPHQRKPHHHKSPYAAAPLTATVKAKHPKHPKARGLALGEAFPCCAAEALAASLRLAGWPVAEADVLALHEAAGGTADEAVSIPAVLEAASASGLAGVRPRWFGPLEPGWDMAGWGDEGWCHLAEGGQGRPDELSDDFGPVHGLILGAELPGAHALTLGGPGAWSWGEWHPWSCFPGAVLEEAWRVVWPC